MFKIGLNQIVQTDKEHQYIPTYQYLYIRIFMYTEIYEVVCIYVLCI
jgi:hypothetical protein